MKAWKNLSIKIRLTILFLMAAVIPSIILGSIIAVRSIETLSDRIYSELSSVRDVKKGEMLSFYKTLKKDLSYLTQTGNLRYTFAKYDRAFQLGHGTKSGVYHALTLSMQKNIDAIARQFHLDDYLFMDTKGNIIASHAKRRDLGSNLLKGPLRTTPLAKGFQYTIKSKKPFVTDMFLYPPAGGNPRMFILIPIINGDSPTLLYNPHDYMGVMAACLSPSCIKTILWKGVHLGKAGEIYIVGPDKLLRTPSRLDPQNRNVSTSLKNPQSARVDTPAVQRALSGKTGVKAMKNYLGQAVLSAYTPLPIVSGKPWALVADISKAEAFAPIHSIRNITILTGAFLYLIAIFIALFAANNITRPLKNILKDLRAIANGNLERKISVTGKDEVGQMAQALRDMLSGVIGRGQSVITGIPDPFILVDLNRHILYMNEPCADLTGFSTEEAVGKLKGVQVFNPNNLPACEVCDTLKEAEQAGRPIVGKKVKMKNRKGREIPLDISCAPLKNLKGEMMGGMIILRDITKDIENQQKIEESQKMLLKVAKEVQAVADQVAAASDVLSSQSSEIAAGAEEQSSLANQVAAAVEEMNATIADVAKNAQEAAKRSEETRNVASQGSQVVKDSVEKITHLSETTKKVAESVEALAEKSREIDKVIDVISSIADQTNLLALNATIEAASAGEAGKGFAVVAGEIKELAKQTAISTESVGEAIEKIQEGIKNAVAMIEGTLKEVMETTTLANKAGESLREILEKAGSTAEMVTGIAAASQQQAAAVEEISKNVDGILTVSQQTAKGVAESARAAKELASLSERMQQTVKRFNRV